MGFFFTDFKDASPHIYRFGTFREKQYAGINQGSEQTFLTVNSTPSS
jgi:hypothetical protein